MTIIQIKELRFIKHRKNLGLFQGRFAKITEKELFNECLNLLPENIRSSVLKDGYFPIFHEKDIPFENLKFPTLDGKIHLRVGFFKFQDTLQYLHSRLEKYELILLTPSHPLFLHSQLGLVHRDAKQDFNKIFLNPVDMAVNEIKTGNLAKISNQLGEGTYQVEPLNTLRKGVAMIYSGMESPDFPGQNANIFVPDVPERMGGSGSYNMNIVKISKVK